MTKPAKIALGIGAAAGSCWLVAGQLGGGPRWVVVWTALACSIASAAYVFNRPAWFGKRAGRLTVRSLSVLPYLAAFRVACEITRRWRAADSASLVAPGVWISGRPSSALLPSGVTCIVDLVAEFPAPRRTRLLPGYRCFPVLDGGVPPDATRFLGLIEELRDHREGILIHCDAGRGRAPTTAAALLIARGLAHEANDAFEMIRARRPIAAPTRSDRAFLTQLTPALRAQATLVSSDHRHGGRLA